MAKKKKPSPLKKSPETALPQASNKRGFGAKMKEEWNARSAILRPLLFFVLIMGTFYAVWATPFFQKNILSKIASGNALFGSYLLNIFGLNTQSLGEQIMNSQFSVNVKAGCDGLEAIMICVAGILVFPSNWSQKLKGIVLGVAFLLLLNLIRIASLFATGIYYPKAFDFMHLDFWQVVFIVLAILTVLLWIQWVNKTDQKQVTT